MQTFQVFFPHNDLIIYLLFSVDVRNDRLLKIRHVFELVILRIYQTLSIPEGRPHSSRVSIWLIKRKIGKSIIPRSEQNEEEKYEEQRSIEASEKKSLTESIALSKRPISSWRRWRVPVFPRWRANAAAHAECILFTQFSNSTWHGAY